MKIRTDNNKEIQEFLFEHGYAWGRNTKKTQYLEYKCLYLHHDKILCYGNDSPGEHISNEQLMLKLNREQKKEAILKSTNLMKKEKVMIHVGSSVLCDMVTSYLTKMGYQSCAAFNTWSNVYDKIVVNVDSANMGKFLIVAKDSAYAKHGYDLKFDASVDMGKIIEFFAAPKIPEIIIKNKDGIEFSAKFHNDHVKFGCAKIDNVVFNTINNMGNYPITAESKTITTINIGMGVFTLADIKAIVEHPYFGKGE